MDSSRNPSEAYPNKSSKDVPCVGPREDGVGAIAPLLPLLLLSPFSVSLRVASRPPQPNSEGLLASRHVPEVKSRHATSKRLGCTQDSRYPPQRLLRSFYRERQDWRLLFDEPLQNVISCLSRGHPFRSIPEEKLAPGESCSCPRMREPPPALKKSADLIDK